MADIFVAAVMWQETDDTTTIKQTNSKPCVYMVWDILYIYQYGLGLD